MDRINSHTFIWSTKKKKDFINFCVQKSPVRSSLHFFIITTLMILLTNQDRRMSFIFETLCFRFFTESSLTNSKKGASNSRCLVFWLWPISRSAFSSRSTTIYRPIATASRPGSSKRKRKWRVRGMVYIYTLSL